MSTVDVFGWKRRRKQKVAEAVQTEKEVVEPVKKAKAKTSKRMISNGANG